MTGCALWYQKIVDFVVTAFDKYMRVEQSITEQDTSKEIEHVMVPQNLPEGYQLVDERILVHTAILKWIDSNGEYIIFTQKNSTSFHHNMDSEQSEFERREVGDQTIFFHFSEKIYTYIWKDDYEFYIVSSRELSDDELFMIIDNVK